jgi:hypothetical protein
VHRSRKKLLRVGVLAIAFTCGPLVLTASCGSSGGSPGAITNVATPDAALEAEADAAIAIDSAFTPPPCFLPSDAASRCTGGDPTFVFYPPLACDPKALGADASASSDAASSADAADGDASTDGASLTDAAADADPCAEVKPLDVSFTSDACGAFVDQESRGLVSYDVTAASPVMLDPADGEALTADHWSIFAWSKGAGARLGPLDRALDWLEPSAHALTPLNGDGYVLELTQGCAEVMRVMVADVFWSPDPASWARLVATTGPVTVRVIWARFDHGAIAPGTVPRASAPITITMKN